MEQSEAESVARIGYDEMADVYANHVSAEMTVPSMVRSGLAAFAHQIQQLDPGPAVDVGCGPGHVTAYLAELGVDIFGIDGSSALLDIARSNHPGLRFEVGQLASLPVETGSLRAVVSKHSIIHTPPHLVGSTVEEFARVLAPGGLLYVSFFGAVEPATHGEPFDHAVTTAYQLDVDGMAELLTAAGFVEEVRVVQQPAPGERQLPHGTFFARRC